MWQQVMIMVFLRNRRLETLKTYLEHTYFITARLWDLGTQICERDPDYYLYVSITLDN